jgi:hypothetical protein
MGASGAGVFRILLAALVVCVSAADGRSQSPAYPPPRQTGPENPNSSAATDTGQAAALLPPRPAPAVTPSADPGLPRYTLMPDVVVPWQGPELPAGDSLASPDEHPSRFHLEASWDHGLWMYSDDDQFHVHVGGNAQVDSTWLIGPKSAFFIPGGATNGVENDSATLLRRARLRVEGDIYDQFDFIVEYDFAHAENENSGLQPNPDRAPSL